MMRMIELGILAAAMVTGGCGSNYWDYVEGTGGTGGTGGRTGTGGTGGTPGPSATEVYVEANQNWAEASCGCLAESIEVLTASACELGHDMFFPVSDEFLLRPLSADQIACIQAAAEASSADAAIECRTTALNHAVACFGDSEFVCDTEGAETCLTALDEDREACASLPESWATDVAGCLTATPAETLPPIQDGFASLCDCNEECDDPAITPEIEACAIGVLADAIADEETGDAAQVALDCLYDVMNRTVVCLEDVTECGDEQTGCMSLISQGLSEHCDEGSFGLLFSIGAECIIVPG